MILNPAKRKGSSLAEEVIPSANHSPRSPNSKVKALVIHYTELNKAQSLKRLTLPEAQVSCHYLIDPQGKIYSLVPEHLCAWHAGKSYWRGEHSVNDFSIGVELVNSGNEPFPQAQMKSLVRLATDIVGYYRIGAGGVLAHSDIAPTRKRDPGKLFDWALLARHQIGIYPPQTGIDPQARIDNKSPPPPANELKKLLADIGYSTEDMPAALRAFQLRWRQSRCDGKPDNQTCMLIRWVATRLNALETP